MSRKSSTQEARRARRGSSFRAARRALSTNSFIEDAQCFTPSGHAGLASLETLPDLLDEQPTLAVNGPALGWVHALAGIAECIPNRQSQQHAAHTVEIKGLRQRGR